LGFSLAERNFSPAMGRKREKHLFCLGESGEIRGDTPRCVYFKVQHHNNMQTRVYSYICTGIQLIINLFICLTKQV